MAVLLVQDEALGDSRCERHHPCCQEGRPRSQQVPALTCFSRWSITLGSSPVSWPSWGWVMRKSTSWPCDLPLRGQEGFCHPAHSLSTGDGQWGKAHLRPLPPEAASQRDGGSGEGLAHGCLHHQLQGLHFGPLDRAAQVPIVPESCGRQALLTFQLALPTVLSSLLNMELLFYFGITVDPNTVERNTRSSVPSTQAPWPPQCNISVTPRC